MDRRLSTLLVALIAMGCQSNQPAYDPFLGRTTVPPPGTMSPPVVAPYYGTTPPPVSAPPVISTPITPGVPATPPQGQLPASPPSGFQYPHGTRQPIGGTKLSQQTPAAGTTEPIGSAAASGALNSEPATNLLRADTRVQPASWNEDRNEEMSPTSTAAAQPVRRSSKEAPVRIIEPTVPKPSATSNVIQAGATSDASGQLRQASAVRELTELPLAKAIKPTTAAPASAKVAALQPTAGVASQPAPSHSANGFGYDPNYKWLKGQLEYSQSKRIWKLRYIPLDGASDDYGGSVVLSTIAELSSYQPGDFVTVHGTVGPQQAASRSFAPLYQLERIERQ